MLSQHLLKCGLLWHYNANTEPQDMFTLSHRSFFTLFFTQQIDIGL